MTVTGTTMNVWYVKFPTGGVFNVTIDGGTPTLVNTSYAVPGSSEGSSGAAALGTNATHTVNIGHASGGRAEFPGIEVFTPENHFEACSSMLQADWLQDRRLPPGQREQL